VIERMAGTTRFELASSAVTVQIDVETQVLTGSSKERKVLKTRSREFLLFPDCSRESYVGSENQIGGRIKSRRRLPTRTQQDQEKTWPAPSCIRLAAPPSEASNRQGGKPSRGTQFFIATSIFSRPSMAA